MVQHVVNMLSHTEFPNPEIDIPHQLVWIADSLTVDAALLCLLGAGILKPCAARPPCAVTVSSGYSTLNPSSLVSLHAAHPVGSWVWLAMHPFYQRLTGPARSFSASHTMPIAVLGRFAIANTAANTPVSQILARRRAECHSQPSILFILVHRVCLVSLVSQVR